MKRRGFLGMLLGAPAVPVAAAVMEKVPKGFTRGLVQSEPEAIAYAALFKAEEFYVIDDCTAVPAMITYRRFRR